MNEVYATIKGKVIEINKGSFKGKDDKEVVYEKAKIQEFRGEEAFKSVVNLPKKHNLATGDDVGLYCRIYYSGYAMVARAIIEDNE